jgi:YfiH family protein
MSNLSAIIPAWPAPANIKAATTTRQGGVSMRAYTSLNLALHVQDHDKDVLRNREIFVKSMALPSEPIWLNQVHKAQVVCLPKEVNRVADAAITKHKNVVCAILTADCLPILVCNQQGTEVAAIHAGWRGLAQGVIENTIAAFAAAPNELLAWLGPAISAKNYEVGNEVFTTFVQRNSLHQKAFALAQRPGYYQADLYLLARQILTSLGVLKIYGGDFCTYAQTDLFYSHRRDHGITGRMASFIYFC